MSATKTRSRNAIRSRAKRYTLNDALHYMQEHHVIIVRSSQGFELWCPGIEVPEQVKDVGNVEAAPRVDGRNMLMVLAPVKKQEPKTGGGSKPRPPAPASEPAPGPSAEEEQPSAVSSPAESVPASPTS